MEYVFGLATALPIVTSTGVSVVTGVAQGVSEQKKQNADAKNSTRMLKFHIDVWVDPAYRKGKVAEVVDGGIVVIHDGKLWIEEKNPDTLEPVHVDKGHHPFTGFYLEYPDENRGYTRGMVSTVTADPPLLNWIFVDKDTYELRHAGRSGSIEHHVGDFDWTSEDHDSMITFDDFEGFLAVEEEDGQWAVYFDYDDDGLKGKKRGRKVVECHLQRRVITGQEVNKWGFKEEGNIGFKKTREV